MKSDLVTGTLGKMAKLLLASLGPFQYILDTPGITHVHCLDSAFNILRNDGKGDEASYFQSHYRQLKQGLLWADRGWKNASHFYSQQGVLRWPGALAECQLYFNKSLAAAKKDIHKSMFYLGAALHLVQDMCVPHHSVGAIFNGHQEFERWATDHYTEFAVNTRGLYLPFSHPSQWIKHNADISACYYPLVSADKDDNENGYVQAAAALIPLTIRTTAGFLNFAKTCLKF